MRYWIKCVKKPDFSSTNTCSTNGRELYVVKWILKMWKRFYLFIYSYDTRYKNLKTTIRTWFFRCNSIARPSDDVCYYLSSSIDRKLPYIQDSTGESMWYFQDVKGTNSRSFSFCSVFATSRCEIHLKCFTITTVVLVLLFNLVIIIKNAKTLCLSRESTIGKRSGPYTWTLVDSKWLRLIAI